MKAKDWVQTGLTVLLFTFSYVKTLQLEKIRKEEKVYLIAATENCLNELELALLTNTTFESSPMGQEKLDSTLVFIDKIRNQINSDTTIIGYSPFNPQGYMLTSNFYE